MVTSTKARVLEIVAAIPFGSVSTYGTIAKRLKLTARQVARILSTLSAVESAELPWYRVVGANGVVSSLKLGAVGRRQIAKLRAEGIAISSRNEVIDFALVAWVPT